ncbi:MAG: DUF4293 domain-containing protein [Bacteroidales bacterium]
MIQRIQTIYLAVAAALSGILLNGSIVKLIGDGGEEYRLRFSGIYQFQNDIPVVIEKSLPLAILLILSTLLFIISIFLFRRRKLQIRLTVLTTLLSLGSFLLLLFYTWYAVNELSADYIFNIKIIFPLAASILGYLAFRGVLKDELLIKSYDRIR